MSDKYLQVLWESGTVVSQDHFQATGLCRGSPPTPNCPQSDIQQGGHCMEKWCCSQQGQKNHNNMR